MMSVCFHTFAVYRLSNTKKKEKGDNPVFRQVADTLLPERLPSSGGIGICYAGFHAFAVCCLPKNYLEREDGNPVFRQVADTFLPERLPLQGGI
jgi:hypothetical protein